MLNTEEQMAKAGNRSSKRPRRGRGANVSQRVRQEVAEQFGGPKKELDESTERLKELQAKHGQGKGLEMWQASERLNGTDFIEVVAEVDEKGEVKEGTIKTLHSPSIQTYEAMKSSESELEVARELVNKLRKQVKEAKRVKGLETGVLHQQEKKILTLIKKKIKSEKKSFNDWVVIKNDEWFSNGHHKDEFHKIRLPAVKDYGYVVHDKRKVDGKGQKVGHFKLTEKGKSYLKIKEKNNN